MSNTALIEMMNAAPRSMFVAFGITGYPDYRRAYVKVGDNRWEWIWAEHEVMSAEELVEWMLGNYNQEDHYFVGMSMNLGQLDPHTEKKGI